MNQVSPTSSNEAQVTVIEAPLCYHDELEQDGPRILPISPDLRATLTALGMHEDAFSSWETFHVSPGRAMLYYFGSMITVLASLSYLQVFGVPLTRYSFTIPSMITITLMFIYSVSIWRMGPLAARSRPFIYSLPVAWICTCLLYTSPSPRDRNRSRMPSSA